MKKVENHNKINPKRRHFNTSDSTSAKKEKHSKGWIYLNKTHAIHG